VDAVAAAGVPRERLVGAQPDERIRLDGVTITPVPARHGVGMADAYTFGRELSGGLYRYLGYVLDDGVTRVYHAGDTVVYEGQAERLRALDVDLALLPINGRDHFREAAGVVGNMDHREAAQLADDAGIDVLVPMHYDTFPENLGYPAHLVDVVSRDHPSLAVLVPSRDRPVLYEKARQGARAGVEVSLFARPNAGWDTSAMARSPVGPLVAPTARGTEQLVAALEDIRRAADHGIRSVLIQDIGVLSVFSAMRASGELPPDMQAKISVMLPVANPAAA